MTTDSLALYVHFPFCLSICPYCDFDRQATGFDRVDALVSALAAEMRQAPGAGRPVHSIFFGGGTPSLMRPDQVAGLLAMAAATFHLLPDAEITLEANPGDADAARMRGFRAAGVTRLSLGVQSLDDAYLARLGRRHSAEEARHAAAWARLAGLRLSLDFMYGLPDQGVEHWSTTVEQALALEPDHLSCYLLTLDGRVPMGRDVERGRLTLPEDEVLAEMYEAARTRLAAAGYEQYEISNWARPGQQSRHNLTYWRDGAWVGVGPGAASSLDGRRWKNAPGLERYIHAVERGEVPPRVEDERPDAPTAAFDHLTLGLRLREGVDTAAFEARFGVPLAGALGDEGVWLTQAGVLEWREDGRRLRIADGQQLLTNEVLAHLSEPLQRAVRLTAAVSRGATSGA